MYLSRLLIDLLLTDYNWDLKFILFLKIYQDFELKTIVNGLFPC